MNQTNSVHITETIEMLDDDHMTGMSDDDDDDAPSSAESAYADGELMHMDDEVTAQLAAAGPVGVAAAAAIASAKKRKRPHSFETNPSIRKRQQNRLLRKLRQTIYEFATRVGQQAIVLVATPGKPNTSYKVFGAKPLEDVVRNLKSIVMEELESALAQQAPPPVQEDPSLFELPPLIIDGIPTPVEKMTQAQLRAFIPLMLKYSTGRGKPGWGRESTRPPWWPKELPWANVRMDARTEDEKQKISWTHALRKIVINCYKFHGREDLLPAFCEEDEKANQLATSNSSVPNTHVGVLKIHNSGVVTSGHNNINTKQIQIQTQPTQTIANAQVCLDTMQLSDVDYTQAMLHSIQNADGTVSIIQVDPNSQIITLPDGTTAQVQGIATLQADGSTVHTVQGLDDGQNNMTVDLTEATLGQDGQIIITGEDGHGYPVSVSGMITLPVSSSVYQSMVANIQQIHTNGDGTLCITPMQVQKTGHQPNTNNNIGSSNSNNSGNANSSNNSNCAMLINGHNQQMSHQQQHEQSAQHQHYANNGTTSSTASTVTSTISSGPIQGQNNLLELCRALNQNPNHFNLSPNNGTNNNIGNGQFNANIQHNIVNLNDRKVKMRKISALQNNNNTNNNNNNLLNASTYAGHTNTSHSQQNQTNTISNNSNNNNNNEEKFSAYLSTQIEQSNTASTVVDSDGNIVIHMSTVDTPQIKMECDVEAA